MAKTTTKGSTKGDAKKDAKIAARKEKREKKRAALTAVLQFVKENTEDADLLAHVAALTPGQRGAGAPRGALAMAKEAIVDLLRKDAIDEDSIWTEFKLGRAEMRKISVQLIKRAKTPEDRIWVAFDAESGVYTLAGEGANAPKGWTGYTPVEVEDIDL